MLWDGSRLDRTRVISLVGFFGMIVVDLRRGDDCLALRVVEDIC